MACCLYWAFGAVVAFAQTRTLQLTVQNPQYAQPGSVTPAAGTHTYANDEVVTLTAAAQEGYAFHWSCPEAPGIDGSTAASVTLAMAQDYAVTLVFDTGHYSFTLVQGTGGTAEIISPVPPDPGHIAVGTMVNVRATAAADYTFERWKAVAPPDEPIFPSPMAAQASVYIKHNVTLTPVFTRATYLLTLDSNPNGIGGTVSGGGYYESGASPTIVASARPGFVFDGWSVVSGDVTITAPGSLSTLVHLGSSPGPWRIAAGFKVSNPAQTSLIVTTDVGGEVTATSDSGVTAIATSATAAMLSVTAGNSGTLNARTINTSQYRFDGWTGPVNDPALPRTTVVVNSATEVHAKFSPRSYNFAVRTELGSGTLEIGGSKLEAHANAQTATTHASGTAAMAWPFSSPVALVATPGSSDYAFEKWKSSGLSAADTALLAAQGPIASTVTASITMPAMPATVTAVFFKIPKNYQLTLTTDSNGGATASGSFTNLLTGVTSSPTITAPGNASYQQGTVVTVTATPAPNYKFNQWTGDTVANPSSATTTVTMDAAKNIGATFTRTHSNLAIEIAPQPAAGAVLDNATNAPPAATFPAGQTVNLRPQAASGWAFDHWEVDGVAAGDTVPLPLLMSSDHTVKAVFSPSYHLTVNVNPAGMGTATGAGDFPANANAPIDVAPANGYIFSNWTVDVGTVSPSATTRAASILMTGNKTATANLVQGKQVTITARSETAGTFTPNATDGAAIKATGSFFSGPTPVTSICHPAGGASSAHVLQNTNITLSTPPSTASAESPKWRFVRWENQAYPGVALGNSFNVTTDVTLCAVYTDARQLTINVELDGAPTAAIAITAGGSPKNNGDTLTGACNAVIPLDATPPAGYVFAGWTGVDGLATSTAANVTLSGDKTVVAKFKTKRSLTVGIVTEPAGGAIPLASVTVQNGLTPLTLTTNPTTFALGHNDAITLTAQTEVTAGGVKYTFAGWDLNDNGHVDTGEPKSASHALTLATGTTIKAVYLRNYTLTIDVDDVSHGATMPAPGVTYHLSGTNVSITATRFTGYVFDKWTTTTGAVFSSGATAASNSVLMSGDHHVTANFKRDTNALTALIKVNGATPSPMPASLTVTVTNGEHGTATLSNGQSEAYNYGDNAGITASTPAGYRFDRWECPFGTISPNSTTNPATLPVDGPQDVTACYTSLHTVKLATETLPGGVGGVPEAGGFLSSGGGGYVYAYGSTVSLQAKPNPGYRFTRWEIDLDGDGVFNGANDATSANANHTFSLDAATIAFHPALITAKAVYAQQFQLTLAINDPAAGSTTPAVGDTSTRYYGEVVPLNATANTGWHFDSWTATAGSTFTNPASTALNSITIAGPTVATANFSREGITLTARILLDGATPSPLIPALTITAGDTPLTDGGTKNFLYGANVTLTAATGLSAYVFTGWSTALSGSANPATLTMDGSKTVTANYSTIRKLTLSTETRPGSETNGGSATATGCYNSIGADYFYKHGDPATLVATPNTGFTFIGWSIDGAAPLVTTSTITMSANHTAKAVFAKKYTLQIAATPPGGGTGATNPALSNPATVHYGQVVNLVATPAAGYAFSTWTSSDTSGSPITNIQPDGTAMITIGGDVTATAVFTPAAQALTIHITVDGLLKPSTFTALMVVTGTDAVTRYSQQQYTCGTGSVVPVVASAHSGYKFLNWTGGVAVGSPVTTGTVTMDAASKTIAANYATLHTVTVLKDTRPSGDGGTVSVAAGYEGNSGASYTYVHGATASITAAPGSGYVLAGWDTNNDGVVDVTGVNTYTFQVNADATIKAIFAKTYTIIFTPNPSGGGTINKPAAYVAYHGEVITDITATPASIYWEFEKWTVLGDPSLDNSTTNPIASYTVTQDQIITANFRQKATGAVTLTVVIKLDNVETNSTTFSVTADGSTAAGHTAPSTLHNGGTKQYFIHDTVKLDAISGLPGYDFVTWDDNSVNPHREFEIVASRTVTAHYRTKARLTMVLDPGYVGHTVPAVGTHASLPAPIGNLYKGMTVGIDSILSAVYTDTMAFVGWTVNDGANVTAPDMETTSVLLDVAEKTATARYVPGRKLEVRVKYETTPVPGAPKTFALALGSRNTVADGAGNKAGIYLSDPNSIDYSVRTIPLNTNANISAIPNIPGYTFVGWTTSLTSDTPDVGLTANTLSVFMDEAKTYTAIFEKTRVKLEVYTIPAGVAGVRGEALGGALTTGPEPRVYDYFYGATPTLKATSENPSYSFVAWIKGSGYTTDPTQRFSTVAETTYPEALTAPVTKVLAYFLPHGLHRLILFVHPDASVDIHHVNVPGAVTQTYTTVDGRQACIADVGINDPYSTIGIHADGSASGKPKDTDPALGFLRWEPGPGEANEVITWVKAPYSNDTEIDYPIIRAEVRLTAIYTKGSAYRLRLQWQLNDATVAMDEDYKDSFQTIGYFNDLLGNIKGHTMYFGYPLLLVNREVKIKDGIFGSGHVENFDTDAAFSAGPFIIDHWTDERPDGTIINSTPSGAGVMAFSSQPGIAGTLQTVTAHIDLIWLNIYLNQPVLQKPAGWSGASITGAGMFDFLKYDTTEIPEDIFFARQAASPPAPYVAQWQRVKGGSAPVLHAAGTPAGYRFVGWDINGDGAADFSSSGFTWPAWPSQWEKIMTADRTVAPVYVRRLDLTLSMQAPNPTATLDRAYFDAPLNLPVFQGGIEVNKTNLSQTKTYDYNTTYTITALPQTNHVLLKWIVEKATANGGAVFDAPVDIPANGSNTLSVTLDYPTKVTAVFAMEEFSMTVDVAKDAADATHGKITVTHNSITHGPSTSETHAIPYGDTPAIEAIPDTGYVFMGWTVTPSNLALPANPAAASTTVQADGVKTVTAHFARAVTLTMAVDPGSLPGNITNPNVGAHTHVDGRPLVNGSQVPIQAGTDGGYDFVEWRITDDGGSRTIAGATTTLTLNGNTTATARYAKLRNVTLKVTPAPTPSIDANRAVITQTPVNGTPMSVASNGTATCNGHYRENTALTVTATPGEHYTFDHWEITIGGVAQPNVTGDTLGIAALTDDMEIRGVFKPRNYTITVAPWSGDPRSPIATALNGNTNAAVSPTTHDFLLGGATWVLPYGSSVTLSTVAADYYQFIRWTDAGHTISYSVNQLAYTFTVSGDAVIHAQFTRTQYLLTTEVNPAGKGTITSAPPRGANPSVHPINDNLTLTAAWNTDTDFDGWTGDTGIASTTLATLPLTMDRDRSVTANFVDIVRLKIVNPDPALGTVVVTGARQRTETDGLGNTIYIFKVGAPATITATSATANHQFDNWTFDPATPAGVTDTTQAAQTFTMTATPAMLTATAHFSPKAYDLTAGYTCADPAPYIGAPIVTALVGTGFDGSPHDFLATPTAAVRYGTPVALAATIAPYYKLERWTDATGTPNYGATATCVFNMPGANTTRIAKIVRDIWKLTAHIAPAGGGTLHYSHTGGIDPLGTPDTVVYHANNPALAVTLSAADEPGKIFTGWTGPDSSGASGRDITLTMNRDRELTANFANARTLTIPADPLGTVTVTGHSPYATVTTNPDGSKTYTFAEGATATVTATPNTTHHEFDTWTFAPATPSGVTPGSLSNPVISFPMDGSYTLTPSYKPKKYNITVRPQSSDPAPYLGAPIAATLQGSGLFPESAFDFLGGTDTVAISYGTILTLTQNAAPYYAFSKWTDSTGTATYASPFTVGVTDGLTNRTIIAKYIRSLYRLRAHVDPAGAGTISASPLGAPDPQSAPETTTYAPGALVTLTANDAPGKIFTHWSGPDATSTSGRNLSVTMNQDRDVTATFANAYKVTIPAGIANGTVTVAGDSPYKTVETNPDGSKTYTFVEGATATITGTPESGHYYIDRWDFTPDISATVTPPPNPGPGIESPAQIHFTVTKDVTVAPHFQPRTYTLTVTPMPAAAAQTLIGEIGGIFDHDFLVNPTKEHLYPRQINLVTTVKDVPGARYRFDSWKEGSATLGVNTTQPFTYDHNANITANYVRQVLVTINEPVDVTPPNTCPLAAMGSVTPAPGTYRYDVTATPSTQVITATAATGFEFAGWGGTLPPTAVSNIETTADSSVATITLTIDDTLASAGDIILTPQFKRRVYDIVIERWERGLGVQGAGGSLNGPGTGQYFYGTVLQPYITTAYPGYRFVGWGWGATTATSRTVQQPAGTMPDALTHTVTADRTISAIFTKVCTLTIDTDPADGSKGTASITSPAGIPLGGTPPVYQYDYGATINLQALPLAGMSFNGWAGAVDSVATPNTSLTLKSNQIVIARFANTINHTLTISANAPSGGSVTMNNNPADATGYGTGHTTPYTKTFTHNQTVQLTAMAAPGHAFTGWTGPVTVNNPSILTTTVVMDANKTVAANFAPRSYQLTVTASPANAGTVSPGGAYNYNPDGTPRTVAITATAKPGFVFDHWDVTGGAVADASSSSTTVTMTADTLAIAIFRATDGTFSPKVLVIERLADGTYATNMGAASITTTGPVDAQGRYTVVGRPNAGYQFSTWGGPDEADAQIIDDDDITDTHTVLIYGDDHQRELHFIVSKSYVTLQWTILPNDLGTVSASPAGSPITGNPQGGRYPYGDTVTVIASGLNGATFDHWEGAISGTNASMNILMDGGKNITAYFKPQVPTWRVTLGFDNTSSFHPSGDDSVTLESTTVLYKDVPPLISKYYDDKSTVPFYCTLAPPDVPGEENYRFEGWTGITAASWQRAGVGQYSLYVDRHLDPRALIKTVNPLLRTIVELTDLSKEIPFASKVDIRSIGGDITPGGIMALGQQCTVRVTLNPNYKVHHWAPPSGASTMTTVSVTGTLADTGLRWEERTVTLKELTTVVQVYLAEDDGGAGEIIIRSDKVRGNTKDMLDDITTHKSSGHIIDEKKR